MRFRQHAFKPNLHHQVQERAAQTNDSFLGKLSQNVGKITKSVSQTRSPKRVSL